MSLKTSSYQAFPFHKELTLLNRILRELLSLGMYGNKYNFLIFPIKKYFLKNVTSENMLSYIKEIKLNNKFF